MKRSIGPMCLMCASLVVIATACAPAPSTPRAPATVPPPTFTSVTAAPTVEPSGVGAPAIVHDNGGNELRVVSSVSGRTLDAFAPVPLGQLYSYAFSPDGHTLAVVSLAQLHLIDLRSWETRTYDIGLPGQLNSIVYSPDGMLLAMSSDDPDAGLRIVDARSGEVKAEAQAGFAVRNAQFTSNGKALMVYGPQLASSGIAANAGVSVGAPKAELRSAADLSVLWSTSLSGVRDGTFPKEADTADTQAIYQPGAAWHYAPAVAFAPEADILYIVHGDQDKLTTVDFSARRTKTVVIHPAMSWLDRLLALGAGTAYAKGMDGTTKQAVISPDGKSLYVVGTTETVTQQAKGSDWNLTVTQTGLQVILVQDGSLAREVDTQAYSVSMLPGGKGVLLSGWKQDAGAGTPWTDIYDPAFRKIIRHLDGVQVIVARRIDGLAVLESSVMISDNACDMASIDPATWTISRSWRATTCVDWLMAP